MAVYSGSLFSKYVIRSVTDTDYTAPSGNVPNLEKGMQFHITKTYSCTCKWIWKCTYFPENVNSVSGNVPGQLRKTALKLCSSSVKK